MATALTKKKRARNGYTNKLLEKTEDCLANFDGEAENKGRLLRNKGALNEKLTKLQQLDDEIIDLLSSEETDDIDKEIEESELFREKVHETLYRIDDMFASLTTNDINSQAQVATTSSHAPINRQPNQSSPTKRVKLPTLEKVKRQNPRVARVLGLL